MNLKSTYFKYGIYRSFISDLELSDLKEIMVKLEEHNQQTEQFDTDDEITGLVKCMKSLVRVVHRFNYTYENDIPVSETNQSRDHKSVW